MKEREEYATGREIKEGTVFSHVIFVCTGPLGEGQICPSPQSSLIAYTRHVQ
jgi:hypothetical protein